MSKRIGLACLALAGALSVWGCGSGGDIGSTVRVLVTPPTATLKTGATQVFQSQVLGATNTGVHWTATGGTFDNPNASTVTYTAPGQPGTYTVTATSTADATALGSAHVTVQASGVALSLQPSALGTLQASQPVNLTATVTGTSNVGVRFSATGGSFSNQTATANGATVTFTAPGASGTYALTATSLVDQSAQQTINFNVGPVGISLLPANPSVNVNTPVPFTATVTGAANTAATYTVTGLNGTPNSGATIDQNSGVFLATVAGTYQVTAASVANPQSTASTTVTVRAVVQVTPPAATVAQGGQQSFAAQVIGGATQNVTWSITVVSSASATNGGTLSVTSVSPPTVLYTAPSVPGTYQIVATTPDGSTGSATVTVGAVSLTVQTSIAPDQSGNVNVPINTAMQVTPTVSGTTNTSVTFSIQDSSGNNITASGTGGVLSSTTGVSGTAITYTSPGAVGNFFLVVTAAGQTVKIPLVVTPPTGSGVVIVQ